MMGRYSLEALEKGRKSSEEKFLSDARSKFGDRFDYSRLVYVHQKERVEIVCPDHGAFTQTPSKHLQATFGCPKCGVKSRSGMRLDDGRERFLQTFADKYADTLELTSPYVSVKDRIRVKCKRHGAEFETTPDALNYSKFGCPMCGRESIGNSRRFTRDEFVSVTRELFGDQFDLSAVDYQGMYEKVEIGCPLHGSFIAKPANFLNSSHGCPKCGRLHAGYASERIRQLEAGQVKPRPTTIALMKVEVFGITSYKLGVSSRRLIDRYAFALREIMFEATLDEIDALRLEQHLHGKFFKGRDLRIFLAGLRGGKRWPGDSEIYKEEYVPKILEDLNAGMRAVEAKDADYWQRLPKFVAPILRIRTVRKVAGEFNVAKPVIRLDTREIYPSATAAARAVGSSQGNVSMVCRGDRKDAKGIKFAHLADFEAGNLPVFVDHGRGAKHVKARKIRCIETGVVYDTITEAAKAVGVGSGKLTMVCKGKRKSAGGYKWEYFT